MTTPGTKATTKTSVTVTTTDIDYAKARLRIHNMLLASGWVEGDYTYICRLGTTVPGSNGYYSFHAHLTVLKDHFVGTLRTCPNPDQYTTSALLAGVLKRVNYHVTINVWEEDSHTCNPRKWKSSTNPYKTDWHTNVTLTSTTNEAAAARVLCTSKTGKVAEALADVFTEATDIMKGRQEQAPQGTFVK